MSSRREIDCLKEYFTKTNSLDSFVQFLQEEKIFPADGFTTLATFDEKVRSVYEHLQKAVKEEKLLLLSFEWRLLPIHQIKIEMITIRSKRDFLYGY